jgi:OmpA-OmpF porin, OOP family
MWDGNKLTLEGQVPDEAAKKAIVDAATAKYGAGNVIDKLTIDAAAKGALTVTLLGQVASDAVKATRGDEAKDFYPTATIDNQLTTAPAPAAPAAKAEDVQCSDNVAVAATFATGSANLTNEARKLLDAVVPCIKGPFEVGGHTDNVGKPESNQALSESRAASVAKYLASKGVDAKLLSTKGYGDTAPIGDNATTEGKAKNRRIEFKKM